MTNTPAPLINFLKTIDDVRREASCSHAFTDILVIGIFATIAGAESWQDMEDFGRDKQEWLQTFLDLPGGIPSHDTFLPNFLPALP